MNNPVTIGRAPKAALLATAAASAMLLASPVFAQENSARGQPQRGEFNPALLKYAARAPVPFQPFQPIEAQTGKSLAPTGTLKSPDGKSVPAKQYYDELNASEKYLNEHGYSLRTMTDTPITLATIPVDEKALRTQAATAPAVTRLAPRANFAEKYGIEALSRARAVTPSLEAASAAGLDTRKLDPKALANAKLVGEARLSGAQFDGVVVGEVLERIGALTGIRPMMLCEPYAKSRSWQWNMGSPSTFAAQVTGSIGYEGQACQPVGINQQDDRTRVKVTAEGNVNGSVFNRTENLLKVTGSLSGDKHANTISASFSVIAMGQTLASVTKNIAGHWGVGATVSKPLDVSTSIQIPIGPINLGVTVGVQGSAGYQYALDLYPTSVTFSAVPKVKATGYAQAGINAVVAEAGAGATFVLIDWTANVSASAGIGWMYQPVAYGNLYADSNLSLLKGNVYAYVKWKVLKCKTTFPWVPCNWEWKQANYDLFTWPGYTYNSVLFNENMYIPL